MSTSTGIRPLGCPERYSRATSPLQNVDVDRDSPPWMPRTLFSCDIAFAECRRRQGFAPLGAQSAILVRHRLCRMSTSTGIRTLGCPERYSPAASPLGCSPGHPRGAWGAPRRPRGVPQRPFEAPWGAPWRPQGAPGALPSAPLRRLGGRLGGPNAPRGAFPTLGASFNQMGAEL